MNRIKDIQRRELLKQMCIVGAAFGAGPLYGIRRSGNAFAWKTLQPPAHYPIAKAESPHQPTPRIETIEFPINN